MSVLAGRYLEIYLANMMVEWFKYKTVVMFAKSQINVCTQENVTINKNLSLLYYSNMIYHIF